MEESAFMKKVAVLVAGVSSSRGQHDRDSAELRRLCGDRDKLKSSLADMTAERDELVAALQACVDYGSMTGDESITDNAIAAIAKARGDV